jgi:hypothetical protein
MNYVRAALRFWWVVFAGLAAALSVLVLMLYRVERTWPPRFVTKAVPYYVASTELLVDSPTGPYLRTATARQTPVPAEKRGSTQSSSPTVTTTVTPVAPIKSLVDAANLYPLYIESDAVARLRAERFGEIPGSVSARGLYAAQGTNRYRPSVLPVMQITAVSNGPANAIRLAEATAQTFGVWLAREQGRAHVLPAERIIVRQLRVPRAAAKVGGTHYGLPGLLALALFGAFLGLAVVADHVFPRRKEEFAGAVIVTEPDKAAHPSLAVASKSQSS